MSIRARLTIAIAIVVLVVVAVLGTVVVQTTRATLIGQVDDQVVAIADRSKPTGYGDKSADVDIGRDYDGSYITGPSDGYDGNPWARNDYARLVYSADGTFEYGDYAGYADDPQAPPDCPEIPSPELDEVLGEVVTLPSTDGTLSYRTLIEESDDGSFVAVGVPLTDVDDAVSNLLRVLLVASAVALMVAIGICWWVIRHGLRPVDHMVATAAAIADGNLGARIERPDPATELGRLGSALNEMMGKIQVADDARTAGEVRLRRFVADAAHELRTPLTSLRGYAELYRQGALADDASVTNAMGRIESEGARMARLVDDLLLLARLDQDRGLERLPVDLGALVRDGVEDFRVVTPERPVTLAVEPGATVPGDVMRLRQIVDNLLANVRTHTPAGTEVRVTVVRDDREAVLTVADSGPGIAADDQERIFERFWRADPARTRSRGGTGLGLAIVASLVEAHGGSISIESEVGQGAAFIVRMPLVG
ncbi:MAG: HAMP domain-containing sensor histidine kinase [Thermomicrobiales bacterium]